MPVLGICYGMQLMTDVLGGKVAPAPHREFGHATIAIDHRARRSWRRSVPSCASGPATATSCKSAPPGFTVTATSANAPVAAMADEERRFYALLFHPEVAHTDRGTEILRNFAFDICGCTGDWTMASFVEETVGKIKAQVGTGRVVCGLSGGVDSTVAALLIHQAIGQNLDLHLRRQRRDADGRGAADPPPLRATEAAAGVRRRVADVPRRGWPASPTRRRSARSSAARSSKSSRPRRRSCGQFDFLAQGTLYPDVIESVSVIGPSHVIKSHHNVGGLPEHMRFKLVEPLRHLFKDEVRAVGKELGLDDEFVWRQPFPGPGLAVRILGEVTPSRLDLVRRADAIVAEEVKKAGWYRHLWQSFAVLLPVQSVGVMGDARTYEYTAAIRAVESQRRHDRRLGAPAARAARGDLVAHRQRSQGHQPRRLRHQLQAAVDDRVGVQIDDAIR